MVDRLKKNFYIFASIFLLSFPWTSFAQPLTSEGRDLVENNMIRAGRGASYQTGSATNYVLSDVLTVIIKGFLGLLGIIFLIMIIIGGFNWMTAAGNDDKVTKAKSTLQRGIIGLIIIVAAYVITAFIFRALGRVVGAPG